LTVQKRRARPDSPMRRPRITLPAPPIVPPFPSWARLRAAPKTPEELGFLAGAALAALHPTACHDHPIGGLWRQRLALANAAALARHAGRTEDEAALRDAFYLRRAGDDPGPAGRLLQAWRRLAERDPLDKAIRLVLRPKDWMVDVTNALDVPLDAALDDVGDAAKTLAVGEGSAIAAAAAVAAVSLQKRPDAEAPPTAAAAGCLNVWWPSARRASSRADPPSASMDVDAMGRRPRPKDLDADLATLAPELRWREWMAGSRP
jgi:Protein of unknown function (DUF1403)